MTILARAIWYGTAQQPSVQAPRTRRWDAVCWGLLFVVLVSVRYLLPAIPTEAMNPAPRATAWIGFST